MNLFTAVSQHGACRRSEKSPSQIPALAEPWFLMFNADCEFRVMMTPENLQKAGLAEIGAKWK